MVHSTSSSGPDEGEHLAPVTYVWGAKPVVATRDEPEVVPEALGETGPYSEPSYATRDGISDSRVSSVVISQLARRGMSRWELEQVLKKRGIEMDAAAYVDFERLELLGILDDAALAESLVDTLHGRKGLGRTAVEHELRRRHIADDLIAYAVSEIADEDELERATALAIKRIGQLSSYDDETAKRRLNGFLARKGYSSSVIRGAMTAAMSTRVRGGVRFR